MPEPSRRRRLLASRGRAAAQPPLVRWACTALRLLGASAVLVALVLVLHTGQGASGLFGFLGLLTGGWGACALVVARRGRAGLVRARVHAVLLASVGAAVAFLLGLAQAVNSPRPGAVALWVVLWAAHLLVAATFARWFPPAGSSVHPQPRGGASAGRWSPLTRLTRREAGQTAAEYLGLIAVVGLVIASMLAATPGIGDAISTGVTRAVCEIASPGGGCGTGAEMRDPSGAPPDGSQAGGNVAAPGPPAADASGRGAAGEVVAPADAPGEPVAGGQGEPSDADLLRELGEATVDFTTPFDNPFTLELARENWQFVSAFVAQLGNELAGLVDTGRWVWDLVTDPETRAETAALIQAIIDDPLGMLGEVWNSVKAPIEAELANDRGHAALGRITAVALSAWFGGKGTSKLRNFVPDGLPRVPDAPDAPDLPGRPRGPDADTPDGDAPDGDAPDGDADRPRDREDCTVGAAPRGLDVADARPARAVAVAPSAATVSLAQANPCPDADADADADDGDRDAPTTDRPYETNGDGIALEPNGNRVRNYQYAGRRFDKEGQWTPELDERYPEGVTFTDEGFPDFTPYAKATATPEGLNGTMPHDAKLANSEVGLGETPRGYTWHHVEDGRTLELVPTDMHRAVGHTGGASYLEAGRVGQGGQTG